MGIYLDEFRWAKPALVKWVGPIPDIAKVFDEIDRNRGGYILFDEFAAWAIKRGLQTETMKNNKQYWERNDALGEDEFKKVKVKTSRFVKVKGGKAFAMPYK